MVGVERGYVRLRRERGLARGDRTVRVREAGDPAGTPLLHFHATPGSRLDLAFADDLATARGVRLVSFNRPGYGAFREGA